jgi:hypothetical protein
VTDQEIDAQPDVRTSSSEVSPSADVFVTTNAEPDSADPKKLSRSFAASPRPRVTNRQRRPLSQKPLVESNFVPTTLIIYIDKGEVKTRIEPQLTASLKKSATTF